MLISNYSDKYRNKIFCESEKECVGIKFIGRRNKLVIHNDANIKNIFIRFQANDSKCIIGNVRNINMSIVLGEKCIVTVSNEVSTSAICYLYAAEETQLFIAEDTMIAGNCIIRTSDAHPIFDVTSKQRLNKSMNVYIGRHVWIAHGCSILKGAHIGDGSIIGTMSLVTGKIPNNVIATGIPARVSHVNVAWLRKNVSEIGYKQDELDFSHHMTGLYYFKDTLPDFS